MYNCYITHLSNDRLLRIVLYNIKHKIKLTKRKLTTLVS